MSAKNAKRQRQQNRAEGRFDGRRFTLDVYSQDRIPAMLAASFGISVGAALHEDGFGRYLPVLANWLDAIRMSDVPRGEEGLRSVVIDSYDEDEEAKSRIVRIDKMLAGLANRHSQAPVAWCDEAAMSEFFAITAENPGGMVPINGSLVFERGDVSGIWWSLATDIDGIDQLVIEVWGKDGDPLAVSFHAFEGESSGSTAQIGLQLADAVRAAITD